MASSSHLHIVNKRTLKRLRAFERLSDRLLLAADLGALTTPDLMPLEPAEMVQREQAYYASAAVNPPQAPLANTFRLHSRPTATKTIYLDFDGNTTVGTSWNRAYNVNTIVSPAYDPDRNGPSFTNAELTRIQGIWQRVAADFSPFNVNVTTEDPGQAALVNTGGGDVAWGIRAVMTVDNFAASGAGGFAYIGSFSWGYEAPGATDTPCFIFNTTEVSVAAAISHEVGHSLGLSHDGTNASHPTQPNAEYYNGHGTGENSWGPIMGVGGYYRNVTTWDFGGYFGASNGGANANYGSGPDDIAVMTSRFGFGVIPDDHGDTTGAATTVTYLSANATNPNLVDVSLFGTISARNDLDFIRFETGSGLVNLTIDPYISELWTSNSSGVFSRSIEPAFYGAFWSDNQGTNLDVEAKLFNAAGVLIATSSPAGLRASFPNLSLTAGTYFISVDGVGFGTPTANPPIGYTDYGSLGQFLISGTVTSLGIDVNLGEGIATYTENAPPVLVSPAGTFRDSFGVNYDQLNLNVSIIGNAEATDRLSIISTGTGNGQISVNNNRVSYGSDLIGNLTPNTNSISIDITAVANQPAMEALIRSIAFASISDGPSTLNRRIEMSFGLGVSKTRDVAVIAINDSPSIRNSFLPVIDEDSQVPVGRSIDALLASTFTDPDLGSFLAGIAVVGNLADNATEGTWYYSSNQGTSWAEIGAVDDSTLSLLLSPTNWIGFRPIPDFFGTPTPLNIRVLDNTFSGTFSNSVTNVRTFLSPTVTSMVNGPVSVGTGNLIASIRNINDAPVANAPLVQITATQDQPVVFKFDEQFKGGLFTDIDSPKLTWTLIPIGLSQLPSWINFDADAHILSGTPNNADVGLLNFQLSASDSLAAVLVPLRLNVLNVNDPPEILNFTGRSVNENDVGAVIGQITGFDQDLNDVITYTTVDSRFYVNDGQVLLQSSAFIDFETEPVLNLMIIATDNGSPALSTSKVFTIGVRDVNEFFPAFSSQELVIPYQPGIGQVIGVVKAIDLDTRQTVKYRIQQDDANLFEIDSISGVVRLKPSAQVTEKNYRLFIGAYDNGEPSNSRVVLFNVTVEIPNLATPEIASGRNLSLAENSAPRTIVGQVVGRDADGDTSLRYSIDSSLFMIDPITGWLSTASGTKWNFEAQSTYTIQVSITDSGSPTRTGTYPVTISLLNVNDAPNEIRLVDSKVPTLQKGVSLSKFLVTDEDPAVQYFYSTSDSRFEVRDEKLALRANSYFESAFAGSLVTVEITVTDAYDPASSSKLPLTLDVYSNPFPWQNRASNLDVNSDGGITALDAMLVINALNSTATGRGPLSVPRELEELKLFYIDTSGDNVLSPLDALLVINKLTADRGEGEAGAFPAKVETPSVTVQPETWFGAFTSLEEERRRRS